MRLYLYPAFLLLSMHGLSTAARAEPATMVLKQDYELERFLGRPCTLKEGGKIKLTHITQGGTAYNVEYSSPWGFKGCWSGTYLLNWQQLEELRENANPELKAERLAGERKRAAALAKAKVGDSLNLHSSEGTWAQVGGHNCRFSAGGMVKILEIKSGGYVVAPQAGGPSYGTDCRRDGKAEFLPKEYVERVLVVENPRLPERSGDREGAAGDAQESAAYPGEKTDGNAAGSGF